MNEIDATVINAIDKVRARVEMPGILTVDPNRDGNQAKMRQIVRRERKVELAKESLMLFDMRRWRVGALQNAEPTYVTHCPKLRLLKTNIPMVMMMLQMIWCHRMELPVQKEI